MRSEDDDGKPGRPHAVERERSAVPLNSLFTDDGTEGDDAVDEQDDLPDTPHGSRVRARMACVQALYQWLQSGTETAAADLITQFAQGGRLRRADRDFFEQLLRGVVADKVGLEQLFDAQLSRPAAQLDPVEHAILLIATYELRHRLDIPMPVVIDQACNMARIYGAQDGYRFINGVLDATARTLRSGESGQR